MHLKTNLSPMIIKDLAGSQVNFARGEEYFRKHRVTGVMLNKGDKEEQLSATIKGKIALSYATSACIEEDTGDVCHYQCTCPAFAEYDQACKHIVALLLYRYYYTNSNSYKLVEGIPDDTIKISKPKYPVLEQWKEEEEFRHHWPTDPRIKSLIDRYVLDDVVSTTAGKNVKAVPKLEIYEGMAFLSITVGSARQYVVKNMENFYHNIKIRSKVSYGKELELLHHIDSFEQESQPLIKFILHKQEEKSLYSKGNDSYSYRYGYHYGHGNYGPDRDKKCLKLTPSGLDELFDLLLECNNVTIGTYGDISKPSKLMDKTPDFYLQINELSRQRGFTLNLPDCEYLLGEKHVYLYCHNKSRYAQENNLTDVLCRCDQEFSIKIKDLVVAKLESRQLLTISNDDMVSFYVNVLSELKDVLEIRGDLNKIKKFAPDEMQTNIYLDSPRYDVVTAIVKYQYGKVEIDPNDLLKTAPKGIARDDKKERRITLLLNRYFKNYDPNQKFLFIQGDDDLIYQFVSEGFEEIAKLGAVFASDRFKNMGIKRPPQISVGVRLESNLLKIELDTKELPLDEAMDALNHYRQKRKYYRMKDGSFIKLDDAGFSDLADMVDGLGLSKKELSTGKISVPKYRAMYLDHLLKNSNNVAFERNGHFKSLIRNMKAIDDSDFTVPDSLERIMRGYQKDGYRWLATMDSYGFGGILADDMGLGKTIQMLSLLLSKKEEGKDCSALVVCPASLVLNWQNEILKFAPQLSVLIIMGTLIERKALLKKIDEYEVVITSYDLLKRDVERYKDKVFRYHVIDEAQYIKNQGTQNAKAVKTIKSEQRFALTGTPVENRLSELWSIFDFLMPAYLYSYKKFKNTYETDIVKSGDKDKMAMLGKQVAPFMLRRLKSNVLKELPDKVESVVYAQMEGEQKKLYFANLAKTKSEINKNIEQKGFESSKIAILALLTKLRQICCHPSLCYEDYKAESAKLEVCIELLLEATSSGHKVLLFSQFTSMLDIIEDRLSAEGISYYMLTGSTSKEKRMELVDKFNANDTQVFLISLKAGGTGLNLTGADVVIHYDPWWNIAAQNQATDRTHRIGQKNSVQVYKLIEKGTIEEKILKLQESKKDLADAIIRDDVTSIGAISQDALMELLT